ncbi:hypothetical protein F5878DRAFT_647817, partial [Lentinula raphanica]
MRRTTRAQMKRQTRSTPGVVQVSLSSVEAQAPKRKKRAKAGKNERTSTDSEKEGPPNKKSRQVEEQNEPPINEDSASRAPATATQFDDTSEQNERHLDEHSAGQAPGTFTEIDNVPTNDRVGPPGKGKKKKVQKKVQPATPVVGGPAGSPLLATSSGAAGSPSPAAAPAPNPPLPSAAHAVPSIAPTNPPATPVVGAAASPSLPHPVAVLEEEEEEQKLPAEPVSFPDDWDEDDGLTSAILAQDYDTLAKLRANYVTKARQSHAATVRRILERFRFHLIALAVVPAKRAYYNTLDVDTDTANTHQIAEYVQEIDPQGFWGAYAFHMYLLRELAGNM